MKPEFQYPQPGFVEHQMRNIQQNETELLPKKLKNNNYLLPKRYPYLLKAFKTTLLYTLKEQNILPKR